MPFRPGVGHVPTSSCLPALPGYRVLHRLEKWCKAHFWGGFLNTLLHEIIQVESTSLVFFGKTHDQAQVRLDQKLSGLLITHVEALRSVPLLCCGEER